MKGTNIFFMEWLLPKSHIHPLEQNAGNKKAEIVHDSHNGASPSHLSYAGHKMIL